MRLRITIDVITYALLSAMIITTSHAFARNQLTFSGAVVRPPCIANNTNRLLELSCQDDVVLGRQKEKYNLAVLAKLHVLYSKYKVISFSSVKGKQRMARIGVTYK